VAALVVDEAHCIAEWGPSFRPAYLSLGSVAGSLGARTRAAFTATAGARVLEAIRHGLFAGRAVSLVAGDPDRPNLRYRVLPVLSKDRALESLVRTSPRPLVVFCRSRSAAEHSARTLRRRLADERIFFYHAGLDAGERAAVERWFLGSGDGVLTATSAYGMGVDKPDIRTVVHRDLPPSPEAYLQEVGRAGRDGEVVQASLLASEEDRLYAAALADPLESRRFAQMLSYSRESRRCRRRMLLEFLGQGLGFCAGCDVCDAGRERSPGGSAEATKSAGVEGLAAAGVGRWLGRRRATGSPGAEPEGQAEILAVIERHSRRLTLRELTLLLLGASRHETAARGLDRLAGFGILAGWEPEDVEAALEMLQRAGRFRLGRGLWVGRVVARVREP
jgi:superfamily II DNA helicase RecQ